LKPVKKEETFSPNYLKKRRKNLPSKESDIQQKQRKSINENDLILKMNKNHGKELPKEQVGGVRKISIKAKRLRSSLRKTRAGSTKEL
jgi:protein-tyrosine-phosphatase